MPSARRALLLRVMPPGLYRLATGTLPVLDAVNGPGGLYSGVRSTQSGNRWRFRAEATGEGLNPSHVLDYYRYFSDSWVEYTRLQADILRAHVDDQCGFPPTLRQAWPGI